MKRLKNILLVDDDEATNFYHRIIIDESNSIENVHVATNGKKALDFLSSCPETGNCPQLILLDINMPVMNGWEFAEAYAQLPAADRQRAKLVMLTTSINPDDRARAEQIPVVDGFRNKPLDADMLEGLLNDLFKAA